MDNVRILPLLVFAGLCLLILKSVGLLFSGGYVLSGAAPAVAQNAADARPAADESDPGTPAEEGAAAQTPPASEQAGNESTQEAATPEAADASASQDAEPKPARDRADTSTKDVAGPVLDPASRKTKAERAILEGLANRRKTLDKRARELELRENLLKAAQKRVEAKIAELKVIESRIEGELKKRDDGRKAEYQRLVQMYSNMKPKDAARIFDRLDMNVLTGLVRNMKPRVMSAILAAMKPAAAERLTLEIAHSGRRVTPSPDTLPKISGR